MTIINNAIISFLSLKIHISLTIDARVMILYLF